MTTHASMSVPRRPFASLDESRLQSLQSIKNRQNAISASSSTSAKRPYSAALSLDEDTENIDPALASPKKAKYGSSLANTSKLPPKLMAKTTSQFILTTPTRDGAKAPLKSARSTPKPIVRLDRPSASRTAISRSHTSIFDNVSKSTPLTQPAGRSPKHKRVGILDRKRTASPFTRIDPPAKLQGPSPLSIDAALSGTIPGYADRTRSAQAQARPAVTLEEKPTKASWYFDIHEDTLEETLTNIMEFSTGVLDISDDEDRRREKDDRGKENIPPESGAVANGMDSAVDMALPESEPAAVPAPKPKHRQATHAKRRGNPFYRAPLSDLPPTDFYEESTLSGTSFTVAASVKEVSITGALSAHDTDKSAIGPLTGANNEAGRQDDVEQPRQEWPSTSSDFKGFGAQGAEEAPIEIWESESAAGDEKQ